MNPKKDLFSSWLNKNLSQSPPAELDQRILAMAKRKLIGNIPGPEKRRSKKNPLLISVFASILVLIVFSNKTLFPSKINKMTLNEPMEMILNYRNIELMADTSELTEEDWSKIESIK